MLISKLAGRQRHELRRSGAGTCHCARSVVARLDNPAPTAKVRAAAGTVVSSDVLDRGDALERGIDLDRQRVEEARRRAEEERIRRKIEHDKVRGMITVDGEPISRQVAMLRVGDESEKTQAALVLGILATASLENQVAIVRAGAVSPLVQLLEGEMPEARGQAAVALRALAANNTYNKAPPPPRPGPQRPPPLQGATPQKDERARGRGRTSQLHGLVGLVSPRSSPSPPPLPWVSHTHMHEAIAYPLPTFTHDRHCRRTFPESDLARAIQLLSACSRSPDTAAGDTVGKRAIHGTFHATAGSST